MKFSGHYPVVKRESMFENGYIGMHAGGYLVGFCACPPLGGGNFLLIFNVKKKICAKI